MKIYFYSDCVSTYKVLLHLMFTTTASVVVCRLTTVLILKIDLHNEIYNNFVPLPVENDGETFGQPKPNSFYRVDKNQYLIMYAKNHNDISILISF